MTGRADTWADTALKDPASVGIYFATQEAWDEFNARMASLLAEVDRLNRERNEWKDATDRSIANGADIVDRATKRAEAAEARLAETRKRLGFLLSYRTQAETEARLAEAERAAEYAAEKIEADDIEAALSCLLTFLARIRDPEAEAHHLTGDMRLLQARLAGAIEVMRACVDDAEGQEATAPGSRKTLTLTNGQARLLADFIRDTEAAE